MTQLAVHVIGELRVTKDGRLLTAAAVGSRKARTLLALLAVRGGPVSVNSIAKVLWDCDPPRDPAANVATLVSRMKTKLGAALVEYCDLGYRLSGEVRVDLPDAAELVNEAEAWVVQKPATAFTAAMRALHLLENGEVLVEESDASWAGPARRMHGDLLRRARYAAGESALRNGDLRAARTVAERAAIADPFDEAACRTLMRAHHAAGEPARALLTYERLRGVLSTELGVDPAATTRDLHVAILRDSTELMVG